MLDSRELDELRATQYGSRAAMELRLLRRLGWLAPAVAASSLAILVSLQGGTPGKAADVPLSISISGNHFVDGAGQTVRLLGVDHASFEYGCVDGFGYDDGQMDDDDAAAIASWHATAVRVPLNEDCWLGINGQPNSNEGAEPSLTQNGYQHAVESYVADLNAHGLYAILDLHWTAPGDQVAAEQQPMPDYDHSPAFWQSVASTFKDNPAVVFDVFNEPYDPTDPSSGTDQDAQDQVTWKCWDTETENGPAGGAPCDTSAYDASGNKTVTYRIAGMQALVSAIRNTGATQPIMVAGLNYANDLSQWLQNAPDDPLDQEAASFHNYEDQACNDVVCWNSTIAPVAAKVPVVTGEFGEDDFDNPTCSNKTPSTFDADFMNWADQHGASYLAWGWELLSATEVSAGGCSAFYLTTDADGTPAAPNGIALYDHLAALAGAGASTTTTTTATNPTITSRSGAVGAGNRTKLDLFKARVDAGASAILFVLRAARSCNGRLTGDTVNSFALPATAKRHVRHISLGAVRFTLVAGRARMIMLKLSEQSYALLARRRSLKVRFTVNLGSGMTGSVTRRTVTLRLA